MDKDKWIYYLLRIITFPFAFIPFSWIRFLGKIFGSIAFYFLRDFRKCALGNLALARDLNLSSNEILHYAKKSIQNLAILVLEYPKLARTKNFSSYIQCENPEVAEELHKQGKGFILCGEHQSNFEVGFLDATTRMKGIAVGKPINNKYLYSWMLSIREKNGGKIIEPHNALRNGILSLQKGDFFAILCGGGRPGQDYSFPLLGRRAWTSTIPAVLAFKTNSPLIFVSNQRIHGRYKIRYSNPIWPDLSKPLKEGVALIMNEMLIHLQESIKNSPGELIWQKDRWKQQTTLTIYDCFCKDCICIILPDRGFEELLPTFKMIYPLAFLILIVPEKYRQTPLIEAEEIIYYTQPEETLKDDYRFKLIFNFTNYKKIVTHYKKLSALDVLDFATIKELALEHTQPHHNLSDILLRALCKPGTLWTNETAIDP